MKIFIPVLIFISHFSLPAFSQNGTVFYYNFKPNHTYLQTIDQKENSETLYSGDSAFTAKMKLYKLKDFENSENTQHIEASINTDSLINDSSFKMAIEFTKTSANNNPIVSNGTKIFAHCKTTTFFPIIDSISILAKSNDNDATLIELAKSVILNIDFPEKKLAVGEVFFKSYPVPFSSTSNEPVMVSVGTGYKLLSIDKGIAKFEIKQVYKINLGKPKIPSTISGEGKGTMLFDIKENFFTAYELHTKLVYKVKKENYTIQTTTSNSLTHYITIGKK
jgi:hypothetical protein